MLRCARVGNAQVGRIGVLMTSETAVHVARRGQIIPRLLTRITLEIVLLFDHQEKKEEEEAKRAELERSPSDWSRMMDVQGIGKIRTSTEDTFTYKFCEIRKPATQVKLEYVQNNATKTMIPMVQAKHTCSVFHAFVMDVDRVKVSRNNGKGNGDNSNTKLQHPQKGKCCH